MAKKPQVGRPAIAEGEHQDILPVRIPRELRKLIDTERAKRVDAPSRSAFVREMLAIGLEVTAKKRARA